MKPSSRQPATGELGQPGKLQNQNAEDAADGREVDPVRSDASPDSRGRHSQTPQSVVPGHRGASLRFGLRWFRRGMALAVAAALGYTLWKATGQLESQSIPWNRIHWWRFAAGVVLYVGTLLMSGAFWKRVLERYGPTINWNVAWRAFACSQLGKYIPGKAMVVVIRADMVRDSGVALGAAVASSFIETLLWVFVGAQIASLFLLFSELGSLPLRIAAITLLVVSGLITLPPNFNRILNGFARLRRTPQPAEPAARQPYDWLTFGSGLAMLAGGWCLAGASAWMMVSSIPDTEWALAQYPLILSTVALATVGGFVSLLPGGMGVRELVIIPMLSPALTPWGAILAAILIRVGWILSELLLSGTMQALYRIERRRPTAPLN